jgi:hypothetical protein
MAKICLFESPGKGASLQILMKRALELLKNLFKALIFWFFLIKQKEQIKVKEKTGLIRVMIILSC